MSSVTSHALGIMKYQQMHKILKHTSPCLSNSLIICPCHMFHTELKWSHICKYCLVLLLCILLMTSPLNINLLVS